MDSPNRKLEALRNLAERPGTEAEGILAKEMLARRGFPDRGFVTASRPRAFAGLKVVTERTETVLEDDFYSAITAFGGQPKKYGPLYFVSRCPQPIHQSIVMD